jgi:hypothetical protein
MKDKDSALLEARILELKQALHDCLVYCPEYMHGIPKKEYQILLKGNCSTGSPWAGNTG